MTVDYILDSNILILFFNDRLAEPLPSAGFGLSVITEIELLSYPNLSTEDETLIRQHLERLLRFGITDDIKQRTIQLRRWYRLRVPDAIIAATAMAENAVLLTNDQQLQGIEGLRCRSLKAKEQES